MPVHSVTEMKVNSKTGVGNGPKNADPRSQGGTVDFIADAPCLLIFSDPTVFGMRCAELQEGSNILPIAVEKGKTSFKIQALPQFTKAPSGPNDIIVP